jgi:hypothetical protein
MNPPGSILNLLRSILNPTAPRPPSNSAIKDGVDGNYISKGAKLMLLDNPEGKAVLETLEPEHAADQAATARSPNVGGVISSVA